MVETLWSDKEVYYTDLRQPYAANGKGTTLLPLLHEGKGMVANLSAALFSPLSDALQYSGLNAARCGRGTSSREDVASATAPPSTVAGLGSHEHGMILATTKSRPASLAHATWEHTTT
jgi:hypothetical protein